jgi:fimbrial isopeptide formation D2 family protein/uncharacterized repeat protein (TIGR01451 family)
VSALLVLFAVAGLAQPIPTVTIVQPAKDALTGGDVTFCLKFKNASPTAAGFGPFVDLVFPAGGADFNTAAGPCDGATFVSARVISTTPPVPLLPESPISTATPCGSAGASIPHPYAGSLVPPVVVRTGQLAGQLVVLPLPFGSFEPNQPEMTIEVTAHIHPFADNAFTLPVYVRGGFRYGGDALDNGDQPRVSASGPSWTWPTVQNLTPGAVVIHKEYAFPENETVTGPNFVKNYKITVDVAPAQTVTNLTVQDCLPPSGVWSLPAPANGTILGNCLNLTWPTLTGGNTLPTAASSPGFWINNAPPITPSACSAPFNNTAVITGGSWTPSDPRDPVLVLSGSAPANITKKALAIQKTAQVLPSSAPAIPGATIRNTLRFQVSDYLRFGSIVVTDTLSGGQQPVNLVANARWRVKDRFGPVWSPWFPFPATSIQTTSNVTSSYTCPPSTNPCLPAIASGGVLPGGLRIQFNLSQAMIAHTPVLPMSQHNGILTGGLVSGPPSPFAAEGEIFFDVKVLDMFASPIPNDDGFVDKDDPLLDKAVIIAKQYNNKPVLNPAPTGASCSDVGNSCLAVPSDMLIKEVVAINGVWQTTIPNPTAGPSVTVGDTVTYRLRKTIPSGDAQKLTIRDWYPLPIFVVPPMSITQCPVLLTFSPPPGQACWRSTPNLVPVTAVTNSDNSVTYTPGPLGTFNNPGNQPLTIEMLSTLTVTPDPFADALLFTNEAQECESNSYGTRFCQTAIAQITLQEPSLKIRKSILCAPGCGGIACPTPIAGCPRSITYPVTSTTLPSLGVSSVQADAGDRITFLVSIENIGTGPHGAFDVVVKDTLGPLFQGTIDLSSICVTNGTSPGTPIQYILLASSPTSWTIELVDPSLTAGSLAPFPSPTGANIALIVFDVVLNSPPNVTAGRCDDNTGDLQGYSNKEGGQNFVLHGFPTAHTAVATVCVGPHDLQKSIFATSEQHTIGADVTIGEIVRYDLTFDVPEGVMPPITITDALPSDLQMDPTWTATVTTTNFATIPSSLPSSLTNAGTPSQVKFQIPSFTNADSDADCEQIHVRFNALVMNTANNHQPDVKPNTATLQAGNVTITSPPVVVHVVEPTLTIAKTATLTGTFVTYVVTVTNSSAVTAFNVVVSDTPPPCVSGLVVTSAPPFSSGNAANLAIGDIAPGASKSITYRGTLTCNKCVEMVNTATVRWTSLPGTGTCANPTTSCTPGGSGAFNGERDGSGTGPNNYIATVTASLCGKVCGTKFADLNGDGIRDPGDFPLGGWTVGAIQGSNTIGSTVTASDGSYCLELPFGTYNICEQPQSPWTQTLPAAGACYTGVQVGIGTLSGKDFGNKPCTAQLCGKKTLVGSTNGIPGPGWVIYATPSVTGYPIVTATTAADGSFCLSPLIGSGSYSVQEVPQNGFVQMLPTSSSVTVQIVCKPGPTSGTFTGQAFPNALSFVNQNVCAGITCPAPQHCIAQNGVGVCITDPALTPCALVRCRAPFSCSVVNGVAGCWP